MTDSPTPLLILTLNKRFAPAGSDAAYGFGVVGFTLSAAAVLKASQQLGGFILYERDEAACHPVLSPRSFCGCPSVEFRFNVRMPEEELRASFAAAITSIAREVRASGSTARRIVPVVYHQTSTLLPFTPRTIPFLVTHHGPFAEEVQNLFGESFAVEAFQGGREKLDYLISAQRRGLAVLRSSRNGVAMEMSTVQTAVLHRNGIAQEKVLRVSPPTHVSIAPLRQTALGLPWMNELQRQQESAGEALHIIAAAARVDAFKNMGQIVDASNIVTNLGIPVNLWLRVGAEDEHHARAQLFAAASDRLQSRMIVAPRLPHSDLLCAFACAPTAVFVCSSLYETLCITALEAALSGVTTLVPADAARIGVAEYVPPEDRFYPRTYGLVRKLLDVYDRRRALSTAPNVQEYASKRAGPKEFTRTLELAVQRVLNGAAAACVGHAEASHDRSVSRIANYQV